MQIEQGGGLLGRVMFVTLVGCVILGLISALAVVSTFLFVMYTDGALTYLIVMGLAVLVAGSIFDMFLSLSGK